jgi:WhiB family transcriptional regulator, redox-sensing transcriptional regulator
MTPDNVSTGPGGTATRLLAQAIPDAASAAMGDWVLRATCATADPGIFFLAPGDSDAEAKTVCARCPVRAECTEYSLATGPHWGIWGGLNEDERNALARRRKRQRQRARATAASDNGGEA